MITLTAKMARTLIANAVTIKGENHIQTECVYLQEADDVSPPRWEAGCIVGVALVQLVGIDRSKALINNGCNIKSIRGLSSALPGMLGITLSDGAKQVFADAQNRQDDAMTWGEVRDSLG